MFNSPPQNEMMLYHLESAALKSYENNRGMEFFICYHQMLPTQNMKWMSSSRRAAEKPQKLVYHLIFAQNMERDRATHTQIQIQRRMQAICMNLEGRHYCQSYFHRPFTHNACAWNEWICNFGMSTQEMGTRKNAFRRFTIDMKCHRFP